MTMFQNLRINQRFYILTKGAIPTLEIGTVSNVTAPQLKFPAMPLNQSEYIVDVNVMVGNESRQFQKLPTNKEIADFGNMIVSSSKDSINNEILILKQKSEDHIARVEEESNKVKIYESILKELNPEYAEKQKYEEELSNLKEQMNLMVQLVKELKEDSKKK